MSGMRMRGNSRGITSISVSIISAPSFRPLLVPAAALSPPPVRILPAPSSGTARTTGPTYRATPAEASARPQQQTWRQSPSPVYRRRAEAFCTVRRQVQAPVRPFLAVPDCSRRKLGNESTECLPYPSPPPIPGRLLNGGHQCEEVPGAVVAHAVNEKGRRAVDPAPRPAQEVFAYPV